MHMNGIEFDGSSNYFAQGQMRFKNTIKFSFRYEPYLENISWYSIKFLNSNQGP